MTQFKARPTTYKGIKMRSRLEAGFAAWLDEGKFDWAYEPCAFASGGGQYLPDFRLANVLASWLPTPVTAYVEVKPDSFLSPRGDENRYLDDLDALNRQIAIIEDSEPDSIFILAQPAWLAHLVWDDQVKAKWPNQVTPVAAPGGKVGFALPRELPWPDGYWQPKASS